MPRKEDTLNFSAEDTTVEAILFSPSRYRIPRYQRSYTWEEDHITDFWSDLNTGTTSYFIGSFVLNYGPQKEENYIEVIDGQQRLLTITIFMGVLRDLAKEMGDCKLAERIQRHCIAFENRRGEQTFRILCGDSLREYFETYIQNDKENITNSDTKKKEEKRVKSNYLSLKKKISEDMNKFSDKKSKLEYLQQLWDNISNIKVIRIKIESEEDAYEIFETVNARGLDLTIADLLKNLIFKEIPQIKGEKDQVKEKWIEIEDNIRETGTELSKFVRYYWLSKYTFITDKKLFKTIKREIGDYKSFLDDLHDTSFLFSDIIGENEEYFDNITDGKKIFNSLQGIKVMGVSQCFVLFLTILRNIDKLGTNPARIFKLIEHFSFNYHTISNLPGNKVEKIYSRYAIELEKIIQNNENIPTCAQGLFNRLEKELKELRPKFAEFNDDFLEMSYKDSAKNRILIKYILSKINSLEEFGEYKLDFDNVNIEHILPRRPDKEWGLSPLQIKSYVDLLGNLTLVHKKINSKIGNKVIKYKIEELKKSEIPITKELVNSLIGSNLKWDKTSILNRQSELSKIGYEKVWAF